MSYPSNVDDGDYTTELKRRLQKIFSNYVHPHNVLHVFGSYSSTILTQADKESIEAATVNRGRTAGALLLLDLICMYPNWYETLLKVLRDPTVKQSHAATLVERVKDKLDNEIEDEQIRLEDQVQRLQEEISLKDQRIHQLEGEKDECNQSLQQQEQKHEKEKQRLDQRIHQLEGEKGRCERSLQQQQQKHGKEKEELERRLAQYEALVPEKVLKRLREVKKRWAGSMVKIVVPVEFENRELK